MKRIICGLAVAGLAGLGLTGLVASPSAQACGGNYAASVEADTSDAGTPISGYCSDGTISGVNDVAGGGIADPAGNEPSDCGEAGYQAAVEADSGQGVTYCSDGTFQELGL